MTTIGTDWLLATTTAGELVEYHIGGPDPNWARYSLGTNGWNYDQLISPGDGVFYGHVPGTNGLDQFMDTLPFNGIGSDIRRYTNDPVDTSGWSQILLSAQPNRIGGATGQ
jgi:hypothetical protein